MTTTSNPKSRTHPRLPAPTPAFRGRAWRVFSIAIDPLGPVKQLPAPARVGG